MYHCKQRIFDGLFKPSGARNCDCGLLLLQQIAFTFTNAESVPSGYFVGLEILFNLNCFYDLILVWDSQCASSPRVSMDFYLCLMPLFEKENREMSK